MACKIFSLASTLLSASFLRRQEVNDVRRPRSASRKLCILQLVSIVVLFFPFCSQAFYSSAGDKYELNLTGFLGAGGGYLDYPETEYLYKDSSDSFWFADVRLLGDARVGENLAARVNVLQSVRSVPVSSGLVESSPRDIERSGLFFRQQHDSANSRAAMVLDAAYCVYGDMSGELTIGRQPVSTTVTFFFTPNDFFAPFSANAFYRVYKPGVDAVRYERRMADLSQLSLIGVLGYTPEGDADGGWSRGPDFARSSALGRFTFALGEFEWGVLGGAVRESMVAGFSMQGELFQWLGVRAEGHYADSWAGAGESGGLASVSFEHRFASSLTLRLEQMYNGHGSDSVSGSLAGMQAQSAGQGRLGRNYSAFDVSYQISPLLAGEALYLRNWSDGSFTFSLNAVYSMSDESDLAFTATIPGGDKPEGFAIRSELGSLPLQAALEYRRYF